MNTRMRIAFVLVVAASLGLWSQGCKKKTGGKIFGTAGVISGNASKGPVRSGTVNIHAVDPLTGNKVVPENILGTAQTDTNGNYVVGVTVAGGFSGAVILEVISGTYTDEATGVNVTLTANKKLTCALPKLSEVAKPVAITPLTTMAQSLATSQVGAQGIETAIKNANAQVSALFGISDITAAIPKDVVTSAPDAVANTDADKAALFLSGLSQLAKDNDVADALDILRGLADDLLDGDLDGQSSVGGTAVAAVNKKPGVAGTLVIDAATARGTLGASMANFVAVYNAGTGAGAKLPSGAAIVSQAYIDDLKAKQAAAVLPTPPTITSLSATGAAEGATPNSMTINGTGFVAASTVTFGTTAATGVTFVSATAISCTPPALAAGIYSVTVTNPAAGTTPALSGTLPSAWTVFATATTPPTLTSIAPTSGFKAGGATVTLTGTGFASNGATSANTTVTIGGQPCTAVTVTAGNDTSLTAVTPAFSSTGAKDVFITNPGGQASKLGAFTVNANALPAITSVTDSAGTAVPPAPNVPLGGGLGLIINGTGFSANNAGANTVTVDGVNANSVVTVSDTKITFVAPPLSTEGAKDVVVINANTSTTTPTKATGAVTYVTAGTWTATTITANANVTGSVAAPTARASTFYVWTGTELIVFGGETGAGGTLAANDGGLYNPATDSWKAVTTTGAPVARVDGEAVWTGSLMLVWGGIGAAGTALATGSRYDPQLNTWSDMATASGPTQRSEYAAVWTGREMILWGGADGTTTALLKADGFRYDPSSGASGAWAAVAATTGVLSGRKGHTAVWTGREMIVWGGVDNTATPGTNTGAFYKPGTDTWTATNVASATLPGKRREHTAVWTGQEMVVWGGLDSTTSARLATGGQYDVVGNNWGAATATAGAPSARNEHTAVWTGKEMIVWGGKAAANSAGTNTGARFTPSTAGGAWLPTGTSTGVPTGRHDHAAVWTGRQMVVWGGSDVTTTTGSQSGGRYTPPLPPVANWTATTAANTPAARQDHSAVFTGFEMIVWGGFSDTAGATALKTGGRYNAVSTIWTATSADATAPAARGRHAAVWTGSRMIVWGGTSGGASAAVLNTGGAYDPIGNAWTATDTTSANLPAARQEHTAVWTGKAMVVWGGTTNPAPNAAANTAVLNTGAVYVPAGHTTGVAESWTATDLTDPDVSATTAKRSMHTAVWTGSRMIVWGGRGDAGTPLNTGLEFDPAAASAPWTLVTTTGAPIGREEHTAIWTGAEMIVWGGKDAVASLVTNSGGRYTPIRGTTAGSWTATDTTDADAPSARKRHTAVWDGNAMIVWGGIGLNAAGNTVDTPVNSGGAYDVANNNWVATPRLTAAGANVPNLPDARDRHTAIHDGTRMVIFGGAASATATLATGAILSP